MIHRTKGSLQTLSHWSCKDCLRTVQYVCSKHADTANISIIMFAENNMSLCMSRGTRALLACFNVNIFSGSKLLRDVDDLAI